MLRVSVPAVFLAAMACASASSAQTQTQTQAQPQTPPPTQPAPSEPSRVEAAQQHITAAMTAFRAQRWRDAIHDFELAYRAAPNADLWYNLGRARELSGDFEGAVGDYQRYLRDKVDPPDRAEVEARVRELQQRAARQTSAQASAARSPVLQVQVEGAHPNLRAFLDGAELPAATLTQPRDVPAGEHLVRVTADGMQQWSARVHVRRGERASVFASLSPSTRYVTRPAPHVASVVLAGLGAVSLGVATYFGARAAGADCDFCEDRVSPSNRSDVLLGVSAGLAVGAVVAFFLERASGRTERVEASP